MTGATRPLLLAHLTDTHVVDPDEQQEVFVDNNARLAEAVAAIKSESVPVDAVLATGDLANNGRVEEYRQLESLLAPLDTPVLALAGNHDHSDRVRDLFPDLPWVDDHASWEIELGGVRIVGLDSTRPGHEGGQFDDRREDWLRSVLSRPSPTAEQTVLTLHHPPLASGIEWMDNSGFEGLDRLIAVLCDHPADRILFGHIHRPIQAVVAGIPAQSGVSTVQHVALDLAPGAPIRLINDPAGYLLHRFAGADSVTHTRYIATGADPFPPSWADN